LDLIDLPDRVLTPHAKVTFVRIVFHSFIFLLVGFALTGCTWVKPTQSSEQIRIVPADRVGDCKKAGEITTYTKAKVAGVNRKPAKVQLELETLAKTEAVDLKANTLVVKTEVFDGKQSYVAYQCPLAAKQADGY